MSLKNSSAKATTGLIESNTEIKSYIHQQILDFERFITPETMIIVIARDHDDVEGEDEEFTKSNQSSQHRIAIILREEDSSIEAEGLHDDIFEAIKIAKEKLVNNLIEIQSELETSQDRLVAIQQAANQVH